MVISFQLQFLVSDITSKSLSSFAIIIFTHQKTPRFSLWLCTHDRAYTKTTNMENYHTDLWCWLFASCTSSLSQVMTGGGFPSTWHSRSMSYWRAWKVNNTHLEPIATQIIRDSNRKLSRDCDESVEMGNRSRREWVELQMGQVGNGSTYWWLVLSRALVISINKPLKLWYQEHSQVSW